ncbi:sensor histidine kinase, partial [Streptomyces erythrochromogenes]
NDAQGIPAREATPAAAEEPRPAPVAPLRPRGAGGAGIRTEAVASSSAPVSHSASVTELPRRVRQASLVPQLREAPTPKEPAGVRLPEDPPGRSPEEARDRMAAYRAGWVRGAEENSPHAGSEGEE